MGGKTTKDKLFGMMKRIMNDDVAILYSFKGQSHSKKSFEDLKFLKLMTSKFLLIRFRLGVKVRKLHVTKLNFPLLRLSCQSGQIHEIK